MPERADQDQVILDLRGCARCHGDGHLGLVFAKLTHPVEENDGTKLTHWAPCPTNGEPILMYSHER